MTLTDTTTRPQAPSLSERLDFYVAVMNAREADRREAVNAKHVAERGRLLYPEGGQYATFTLDKPGRKFTRIVMTVTGGQRSVHAFVDRAGKVYKPAGWKAPAAGARFDLMDNDSLRDLLSRCEFTGGYLYHRR